MKIGFTADQIKKIKSEFPNAYEALRKHCYKVEGFDTLLATVVKSVPEADKVKETMDHFSEVLLLYNFRELYDFFDNNKIYVSTITNGRGEIGFTGSIIEETGGTRIYYNTDDQSARIGKSMGLIVKMIDSLDDDISSIDTTERLRIERSMFFKSFFILENKLKAG